MNNEIIFKLSEINPFPFVRRYNLYDKDGKYICRFKTVEDFEYFVEYVNKHRAS